MWEDFKAEVEKAQTAGDVGDAVKRFLKCRIPEGTTLDYKWKIDLTFTKDKVKIAKYVASFANTRGGVLLLGIKGNDKTGEPEINEPLHPVITPQGVDVSQQVTNIVTGYVYPVPEFEVFPIPLNGSYSAAIFVPASPNRPHVLEDGSNVCVPVRRGTSTVSASREELDRLYADRLATRTSLEQVARQQCNRYFPESLCPVPNIFIYLSPVGTQSNLITLKELMHGAAYRNSFCDSPRWGGGHTLPDPRQWRGCPEVAQFDYLSRMSNEIEYRAITYKNGALSVWSLIFFNGYSHGESEDIRPVDFLGPIYGTLAPWLKFLANFGLVSSVEGILIMNNVANRKVLISPEFNLGSMLYAKGFSWDPKPFEFSTQTTTSEETIIDLCFSIFADIMYAAGHTTDFSDRENVRYSAKLKEDLFTV